ncbi:dihydrodipicolinate synthase/N-acetylneuraminate lyase [Bradyrhizobium sp. LM3.6]
MHHSQINSEIRRLIADGTVLPAHPLALTAERQLDQKHQRALTRYYIDAGSGGLAVGVHTTQFAIRDVGLYRPVLELAAETAANWTKRPLALVAGLAGPTRQAVTEARTARDIGYHAGLLSLAAMKSASEDEIIAHCTAVAAEIPLVGFYLQPAVGGVILSSRFWQRFASIDNVIAIKIAPFNRYRTLDVLRGVAAAGALDRVAIYTGNDDHILLDLMLPFDLRDNGVTTRTYFKGGLLGHWSVWTASAIKQFRALQGGTAQGQRPGRFARARCPRHRLQQRLLRRRQ